VNLSGSATASFSVAGTSVNGAGTLGFDLVQGKLTSGSVTFSNFQLDLPRTNPVLSFQIASATLDNTGLAINGRSTLALLHKAPGVETLLKKYERLEHIRPMHTIGG
jgi:hypothetical protein